MARDRERISIIITARNEERNLEGCLNSAAWADEIVVLLDRCSNRSSGIARCYTAKTFEGQWPIEGERRNIALSHATGHWIFELDADERIPPELANELQSLTAASPDFDYALVPIDNFIGQRLVRHSWGGSFDTSAAFRLFRNGCKHWGAERVHPRICMSGKRGPDLCAAIHHYVDRDLAGMIERLNRYSSLRAADMLDRADRGSIIADIRRFFSRFCKCYLLRSGYREKEYGLIIAVLAGLFPLLSTLKARCAVDSPVSSEQTDE